MCLQTLKFYLVQAESVDSDCSFDIYFVCYKVLFPVSTPDHNSCCFRIDNHSYLGAVLASADFPYSLLLHWLEEKNQLDDHQCKVHKNLFVRVY